MINEAYKKGNKKLLLKLLDISRKNNAIAYETIDPKFDNYGSYDYILNYFFIASRCGNKGHGLIRVLESTIKAALKKGDFDKVQEFNSINIDVENFVKTKFRYIHKDSTRCYIADADEIRVAKLKLDKSVSKIELQVQTTIHKGIVDIKELTKITNFTAIKKALKDYPIHPFELLYRMYQQQKWRELFEFSVDYDISRLSNAILRQNKKEIDASILTSRIIRTISFFYIYFISFNNPQYFTQFIFAPLNAA